MSTIKQNQTLLEFSDVSYRYDSRLVLDKVNFKLATSEMKTILGPNGSGKSTLIKLGLGLLKTETGSASLFGVPSSEFRQWHQVGYVPQNTLDRSRMKMFPCTAEELVAIGMYKGFDPWHLFGSRRKSFKRKIKDAMELTDVVDLADRPFMQLSHGQQQRVIIAQALVSSPALLVLDEPDVAVDPSAKQHLHDLLRNISKEMSVAVLMVSHDIGAVCKMDEWCICLNCTKVYEGLSSGLSDEVIDSLYGHKVNVRRHGS